MKSLIDGLSDAQEDVRRLRDDDNTNACPCHMENDDFKGCTCGQFDSLIDKLEKLKDLSYE